MKKRSTSLKFNKSCIKITNTSSFSSAQVEKIFHKREQSYLITNKIKSLSQYTLQNKKPSNYKNAYYIFSKILACNYVIMVNISNETRKLCTQCDPKYLKI